MMNLYNLQIGINSFDDKAFTEASKSYFVSFERSVDPDYNSSNILNTLMLDNSVVPQSLSVTKCEKKNVKEKIPTIRRFLNNKYLYNFGAGTLSYLKAISSMESELSKNENDERGLVSEVLKNDSINKENKYCFVSLGCGDGKKDYKICLENKLFSSYFPIDINCNFIRIAYNKFLSGRGSGITKFNGYIGDFTLFPQLSERISFPDQTKIFFCLGYTIGNYQEERILNSIYAVMDEDDLFVISFEKDAKKTSTNRYRSVENTEFLLNPLKTFDYYSYARQRYLVRSWVKGLSNIDKNVESYLITLGSPWGSSGLPIHIIWTNRYNKEIVEKYFKNSERFDLLDIREGKSNIVVLLKKKRINKRSSARSSSDDVFRMIEAHLQRFYSIPTGAEKVGDIINKIKVLYENDPSLYDRIINEPATEGGLSKLKELIKEKECLL